MQGNTSALTRGRLCPVRWPTGSAWGVRDLFFQARAVQAVTLAAHAADHAIGCQRCFWVSAPFNGRRWRAGRPDAMRPTQDLVLTAQMGNFSAPLLPTTLAGNGPPLIIVKPRPPLIRSHGCPGHAGSQIPRTDAATVACHHAN